MNMWSMHRDVKLLTLHFETLLSVLQNGVGCGPYPEPSLNHSDTDPKTTCQQITGNEMHLL
jgi:hypothetical protein